MNLLARVLARALDPSAIADIIGMEPDAWPVQRDFIAAELTSAGIFLPAIPSLCTLKLGCVGSWLGLPVEAGRYSPLTSAGYSGVTTRMA